MTSMLASVTLLAQLSVSETVGSCAIRPDEYDGEQDATGMMPMRIGGHDPGGEYDSEQDATSMLATCGA